jgi:DNA mismatch endonuclease (patch repair protein)
MAAIRACNTRPETQVRHALHALGLRYRLHVRGMPGRPDLLFSKHRAVVFINGCFWHGHNCPLFRMPATRTDFWRSKIERNVQNDKRVQAQLRSGGWRVAIIWECALKGKRRLGFDEAIGWLAQWIRSDDLSLSIRGGQ